MKTLPSSFTRRQTPPKQLKHYIVKDDFITNLRRGRPEPSNRVNTDCQMQTQVTASSLMVNKKHEIFSKMKFYSTNDFYDLDKQIEANKEVLYRKINVALRKIRFQCKVKMDNPFLNKNESKRPSFNQERHLSKLIYNVQPFWIKRSMIKSNYKGA